MKKFLQKYLYYFIGILLIGGAFVVWNSTKNSTPTWTTDTVSTGFVQNIISVSGTIDAVGTADLAFPTNGTLKSLTVTEGASVIKGQVLATLAHDDLLADLQGAQASLRIAEADLSELKNGVRTEERDVSLTTAAIAKEDLARITKEQNERVANAYRTLLSSNLEMKPLKNNNGDTAPTIGGTYTCGEGTYTLQVFSSGSQSGSSYRLSGLESGIYTAYTQSAASLGTCGLTVQFVEGETYGNETWTIEIPNTKSSTYTTNINAYNLALTAQANAVSEAKQKLILAEQNNTLVNAAPRDEELAREEASVLQAQSRIGAITAQIQDHILHAPFDGVITNIEPVIGEAVGTTPSITMVSNTEFALTALIPEIDITKISAGQKAQVLFDARQDEKLTATLIFISPLAKEIDGVSYFEAKFILDTKTDWLRSGLNADIDIVLESHENVTRIPLRYLTETNGTYTVLIPNGKVTSQKPVNIIFKGNDGYVQISGLEVGTTIIAP